MTVHDSECVVFALMVRKHNITSGSRKIISAINGGGDPCGFHHLTDHLQVILITELLGIFALPDSIIARLRDHPCPVQVPY